MRRFSISFRLAREGLLGQADVTTVRVRRVGKAELAAASEAPNVQLIVECPL